MSDRDRSRDASPEDQTRSSNKLVSCDNQPQQLSRIFYRTADVDDPPFSRLFLLIQKLLQPVIIKIELTLILSNIVQL